MGVGGGPVRELAGGAGEGCAAQVAVELAVVGAGEDEVRAGGVGIAAGTKEEDVVTPRPAFKRSLQESSRRAQQRAEGWKR